MPFIPDAEKKIAIFFYVAINRIFIKWQLTATACCPAYGRQAASN
jgi:hypothetical protein